LAGDELAVGTLVKLGRAAIRSNDEARASMRRPCQAVGPTVSILHQGRSLSSAEG
jgi:hypothetical protein